MKRVISIIVFLTLILAALSFRIIFEKGEVELALTTVDGECWAGRMFICLPPKDYTWDCLPVEPPYNCGANYLECKWTIFP